MKILLIILQLAPALIDALLAVEKAIPGQGKGEMKLAAIRGMIEAAYEGAAEIWPTIEKVVGVLVGAFNKAGTFQKS